jgi:hypothetical protein
MASIAAQFWMTRPKTVNPPLLVFRFVLSARLKKNCEVAESGFPEIFAIAIVPSRFDRWNSFWIGGSVSIWSKPVLSSHLKPPPCSTNGVGIVTSRWKKLRS